MCLKECYSMSFKWAFDAVSWYKLSPKAINQNIRINTFLNHSSHFRNYKNNVIAFIRMEKNINIYAPI